MGDCEVCGKEVKKLHSAVINSVEMRVCNTCAGLGTVYDKLEPVEVVRPKSIKRITKRSEQNDDELIIDNFASEISRARQKLNLKQDEFAQKINEKSSVIKAVESGKMPDNKLARKLERFLKINLFETLEVE